MLGHNGIGYWYNYLRDGDLYYSPADWAWAGGLIDGLLAIWPYGIPVLAYRSKARFDPDVIFGCSRSMALPSVFILRLR